MPYPVAVLLSPRGVSVIELHARTAVAVIRIKDPARVRVRTDETAPMVIPAQCPVRTFRRLTPKRGHFVTFYGEATS